MLAVLANPISGNPVLLDYDMTWLAVSNETGFLK